MAKKLNVDTQKKRNHNKLQRAKDIERGIRLTWESLESHLEWTHRKDYAGYKFHKQAIKDYAEAIYILSTLY